MKKKNKKSKVEVSLNAPEILEFLNFLSYVRDEKDSWCPSAGKVHHQLYELVVSRIEGRDPKPFIRTTDDVAIALDQKKLQKLAFQTTNLDHVGIAEKYNLLTPEQLVSTGNPSLDLMKEKLQEVQEKLEKAEKASGDSK